MGNETQDPSQFAEVQSRGNISVIGAEAIDISSTDSTPTKTDPDGKALIPRGLLVGVAGNVVCDLADGTTQVTLPAQAGERPWMVTKIYKTNTTATGLFYLF